MVSFGEHAFHDAVVRCLSCDAEGGMFDVDDGGEDERGLNKVAAIAAWNTRAAQPSAGAEDIAWVWAKKGSDTDGDPIIFDGTFGDYRSRVVLSRTDRSWSAIVNNGHGKSDMPSEHAAMAYAEETVAKLLKARLEKARECVALYDTPAQPPAHPVDIVPSHCTGASLSFEPGVLYVSKDGSGYIAIDERHFSLEDDRCDGPDGPEGSVHWITRMDASEVVALRNFLNGSPATPAQPDTTLSSKSVGVSEGVAAIDKPDTGDVAALREATGGEAVIRDGQIVISIDVDALPMIVSGSCATYSLRGLWKVTDAEAFAKDVCMSLNAESENGTTRVHKMFDGAFDHAIDKGAEGIDAITEPEFEAEASRLRLAALSKPNAPGREG